MLSSPIQGRTQCESKMELFAETEEISLSYQILKNLIVLRTRTRRKIAKSKPKAEEILTLTQPRVELGKLEVAEYLNRRCDWNRTGLKEGDIVVHTFIMCMHHYCIINVVLCNHVSRLFDVCIL